MYSQNTWIRLGGIYVQALTEIKPGEICTIKWMTAGAKIAEWMEEHNIKEGSRITVIQNCMGDLIIGTRKGKVAVGKEIAFRIKV